MWPATMVSHDQAMPMVNTQYVVSDYHSEAHIYSVRKVAYR